MKIVSFYTENTIYEKEIEDLYAGCQSLNLDFHIEKRRNLGSWERNCNQKPLFLWECLCRFEEPLLWIDADGVILKKPSLALPPCDLSLYFNDRKNWHARNGTIYLAPSKKTKEFLLLWHEALQTQKEEHPLLPDQPIMISLLQKGSLELEIADLPLEYTQVFDRDLLPLEKTVILHFQASRTAKMPPFFWEHLSGRQLKEMRMNHSRND